MSYTDQLQIIDEITQDCASASATLVNTSYEFLTIDTATQTLYLAPREDDEAAVYEEAQLLLTVSDQHSYTIPI